MRLHAAMQALSWGAHGSALQRASLAVMPPARQQAQRMGLRPRLPRSKCG